ncbi:MAG: glycosyltransferase [Candidatus Bathyarchaeia archaeon]
MSNSLNGQSFNSKFEKALKVLIVGYPSFYGESACLERAFYGLCNAQLVNPHHGYYLSDLIKHPSFKMFRRMLGRRFDNAIKLPGNTFDSPDMILVVDPVRVNFDFSCHSNARKAYYAIDTIMGGFEVHKERVKISKYDYVFIAHYDYIDKYRDAGCRHVFFLPLACDPIVHKRLDVPEIYDFAFVGRLDGKYYEQRRVFMEELTKFFPKSFIGQGYLHHDYVKLYNMAKIIVNFHVFPGLNRRIFEAMACGRLLLTNDFSGRNLLFEDGKHLVIYKDLPDAVEKIKYYLKHEEERETIARNGQNEVYSKHTWLHRAKYILSVMLGE